MKHGSYLKVQGNNLVNGLVSFISLGAAALLSILFLSSMQGGNPLIGLGHSPSRLDYNLFVWQRV